MPDPVLTVSQTGADNAHNVVFTPVAGGENVIIAYGATGSVLPNITYQVALPLISGFRIPSVGLDSVLDPDVTLSSGSSTFYYRFTEDTDLVVTYQAGVLVTLLQQGAGREVYLDLNSPDYRGSYSAQTGSGSFMSGSGMVNTARPEAVAGKVFSKAIIQNDSGVSEVTELPLSFGFESATQITLVYEDATLDAAAAQVQARETLKAQLWRHPFRQYTG